jgi:small-conductance mechanosensitive channel
MIAATLAAAGVAISIASRFIRNRSIGNIFTIAAIAIAALIIFGLFDETVAALDALAFSFGTFRVSLLLVLKAALFFAALFWLALALGKFSERRIRRNTELAPALQVLLSKVIRFGLLTLAAVAAISALGIDLTALTVFSGALGIGLGFGLRSVASNLISGIVILMDRSIKPGDVIEVEGTFGWINSLRARYVSIVTRDGIEYLVPNEHFVTDRVINWSFSSRNVRMEIDFGVDYRSDPHRVREIAIEAVSGLDRILDAPEPVCHIKGFGDSSIDFLLRFWIEDPKGGLANVKGQAFLAIWDAFESAGIKIPYPHREVLVRSVDEAVPVQDRFKAAKPKRARAARQIDPAIEG